ncbi:hypothetical protein D3C71_1510700 [compost metagenome]
MGRLRQSVHHRQGRGLPQGQTEQQSGDAQRQTHGVDGACGVQGQDRLHVQRLHQPGVPVRAGHDFCRGNPPQPTQPVERRRNHRRGGHRQKIGKLQTRLPFHRSLGQGTAERPGVELRLHRAKRHPTAPGEHCGAGRQACDRGAGRSRQQATQVLETGARRPWHGAAG